MTRFFAALFLAIVSLGAAIPTTEILRNDFRVESDPGIQLFVREVSAPSNHAIPGRPILLLHGARVGGVASFDLPVEGGSLAADLAQQGFDVFVMDVRGYGGSTKPVEMDAPPDAHAPLVRSNQAVRDISAVVDAIRQRKHVSRAALFGWATGGQWAGYYASLFPEKVSALIVLNSLYRGSSRHPLIGEGSDLEDHAHPKHFNEHACGAYRFNDANSLLRPWDRSISEQDKNQWRDTAVADVYVAAALTSDSTSSSRTPPSFRSPCGALEDSFYLATGRQLWDASLITAPTLILTSQRDFWSRPEDRENLANDLVHSAKVRVVVIPGATHFVHLDRSNHGRDLLIKEIVSFVPTEASE
jgi:pimeloyl-ACP methyl ester carboxylesterase